MEKNEKIQQKQTRTFRFMVALAFMIASSLILWKISNGTDENLENMAFSGGAIQSSTTTQQQQSIALRRNPMQGSLSSSSEQQQSESKRSKSDLAEPALVRRVQMLDKEVREMKASLPKGNFMETDEKAIALTRQLQDATRMLLAARYGDIEPYRVKVGLKFQPSNPTTETMGETDSFTIELAPSRLQPHSIFTFLEVARHWPAKKGAFHRRAGHVLQVMVRGNHVPHLAFQEYSKEYPHEKGTVGYAGRPSGPAWYVSIINNSKNHGPGTQQRANPYEADSCFGKIVEGFESVVLDRITKMPGREFLPASAHVLIESMTILVRHQPDGEYEPWQPPYDLTEFQNRPKI